MKRILCYGDSNTWGYISGSDHQRHDENTRWTKVLQKLLGESFEVIEEGLSSRTLFSEDPRPNKEGKNGFPYLKPCLESHDKIDYFVLMLGSNEFKPVYNNTVESIFEMIKKYINFLEHYKSQIDGSHFKLIVLGLPPVDNNKNFEEDKTSKDPKEKIAAFNVKLEDYCDKQKIPFIKNNDLITGIDRVHITSESHSNLAKKVCKLIKQLEKE